MIFYTTSRVKHDYNHLENKLFNISFFHTCAVTWKFSAYVPDRLCLRMQTSDSAEFLQNGIVYQLPDTYNKKKNNFKELHMWTQQPRLQRFSGEHVLGDNSCCFILFSACLHVFFHPFAASFNMYPCNTKIKNSSAPNLSKSH